MNLFLIVSVFVAALSTVEPATVPTVLVPKPPTYKAGEAAEGVYVDQIGGVRMKLLQRAHAGDDGDIRVTVQGVDERGTVLMIIELNPRTGFLTLSSAARKVETLKTTCTPEKLYPIVLGKEYNCESTYKINGVETAVRVHTLVDSVRMVEEGGKIVDYCVLNTEDDGALTIKTYVCHSADAKWVKSVDIVEEAPAPKN